VRDKFLFALMVVLVVVFFLVPASGETERVITPVCGPAIGGVITCTAEETDPYKSTRPTIIVSFEDPGVSLEGFSLTNLDRGRSLEISQPEKTEDDSGVTYEFEVPYHIPNGKHQLFLETKNDWELAMETYVNFTTEVDMMDIWVESP